MNAGDAGSLVVGIVAAAILILVVGGISVLMPWLLLQSLPPEEREAVAEAILQGKYPPPWTSLWW